MHLKSVETGNNNGKLCKACGKVSYYKCSICWVCLHLIANRYQVSVQTCFFGYNNDYFFGLAHADAGLSKTKSEEWTYPSLFNNREKFRIINKLNVDLS